MEAEESNTRLRSPQQHVGDKCRSSSFGKKCSHLAKKQRAKFYILRRCIAMLVCWHERTDP
ncbi:DVL family protein [Actinidia rufa]|uniref:DVL family protein n=1 Tax=Actinidia rufa TaxID=165716 RepID=A0A7J0DZ52_9ERIC|nr:DVL family protein [Actinidia rufa]